MSPRKEEPVLLSLHVRASDAETAEEGQEVHNEQSTINADASTGYGPNGMLVRGVTDAVARALQSLQNRATGEQIKELSVTITAKQF